MKPTGPGSVTSLAIGLFGLLSTSTAAHAVDPDTVVDDPGLEEADQRAIERAEKRAAKREAKREARKAKFDGPVPPPEADFLLRDIDLGVRLSFNDYRPGPFSLFTSLAGWNELALTADIGVFSWRDFTIGVGGSVHYGGAWVLGALTQPIANYDDIAFRWRMWEAGAVGRVTFHYTAFASIDPYLFGGIGAANHHLDVGVRAWPRVDRAVANRGYLRMELGGGLGIPTGKRFFLGIELRYLITSAFNPPNELSLVNGEEEAVFVTFPQHKPPKGFSWGVRVSRRF